MNEISLFKDNYEREFSKEIDKLNIKDASNWATEFTGKKVTPSNISYLIQYGRIRKYGDDGNIYVSIKELEQYYNSFLGKREMNWKEQLGADLNWALSFDQFKESDTTKHVHRLHPYKGKFIPQLVEYFLDDHTDKFKKEKFFESGDIILDPFCGSGTTIVQANELGMHAVGIDISHFNTLISNSKIKKYDLGKIRVEVERITGILKQIISRTKIIEFDTILTEKLNDFNNKFFPVPEYKHKLRSGLINEKEYAKEKERMFIETYFDYINKFNLKIIQNKSDRFLDKWYIEPIRLEIEQINNEIEKIIDPDIKDILRIILSRTIRSCRATTHSDLATLKEPVFQPYYCTKHGKICKPLFTIIKWWQIYCNDTIKRLVQFDKLRTNTFQVCLTGDSRIIDIFLELEKIKPEFAKIIKAKKIKGIFSSPPYVGLINYHEQHAYAYDLFGFDRNDELEIGPLFNGQGKEARKSYVDSITKVLVNCKKYLVENYNIFLVANDKFNLYQTIAEKSNLQIVNQFKRPVLNRTEKDKGAYSETIFHLKEK